MMLLITNANNKFRFLTMYFLLSRPIELYMTSRVFMKYSALHSLYCILHVWQGKSIIIKTESHFSPVSFCLFEGACLTLKLSDQGGGGPLGPCYSFSHILLLPSRQIFDWCYL